MGKLKQMYILKSLVISLQNVECIATRITIFSYISGDLNFKRCNIALMSRYLGEVFWFNCPFWEYLHIQILYG